jgi:hypothetical protein
MRISFHWTNHMNIFVLRGTFIFQRYLWRKIVLSFVRSKYIDLTVNLLDRVRLHLYSSSCGSSWTSISLCNICNQWSHRSPTKERPNSIFRGTEANLWATVWSLCCTILYNEGYWAANGLSPNHVSSQNLILDPSPKIKEPLEKKSSFTCIRPFQKGESFDFTLTRDKVFELLCSSVAIPYFHLSAWINICSTSICFLTRAHQSPNRPWSLGRQIKFHFVSMYFFLCQSLCQKTREGKKSNLFLTPFRISEKDSINIGRLLRIEFIRWVYPHTKVACLSNYSISSRNDLQSAFAPHF